MLGNGEEGLAEPLLKHVDMASSHSSLDDLSFHFIITLVIYLESDLQRLHLSVSHVVAC